MRVGFTGTRQGMTEAQAIAVSMLFAKLSAEELHHGDCLGADALAHEIALDYGMDIAIHPPDSSSQRAFCNEPRYVNVVEVHEPKPYLVRNHDIVDDTEALIAAPAQKEEQWRGSGTWATIRYGIKQGKPVYIVYPDGTIDQRN